MHQRRYQPSSDDKYNQNGDELRPESRIFQHNLNMVSECDQLLRQTVEIQRLRHIFPLIFT